MNRDELLQCSGGQITQVPPVWNPSFQRSLPVIERQDVG
jgi:hypothetical protein